MVSLTSNALSVGDNQLSTTFAGTIEGADALFKVGNETLTLSGANLYTGGTTVSQDTLVLTTQSGSAIGTGSGTGAFLAPAHGTNKQVSLTIQSGLIFNSDATDKVVANGVTINSGASINPERPDPGDADPRHTLSCDHQHFRDSDRGDLQQPARRRDCERERQ